MAEPPILIAGPTASGKSALALALAERLGGAVINADSQQVFADWRVLTARPSAADEARAPHHLYGHVALEAAYSVGRWLAELAPLLARLDAEGRPAIVVGGTGLYFAAATEGLAEIPPTPAAVRAEVDALVAAEGPARLAARLAAADPATAAGLDLANPARVRRAWEVLRATGRGLAAWQADPAPPLIPQARRLALMPEPAWLDARIALRFGAMVAGGALAEAVAVRAHLLATGQTADAPLPGLKALGARELIACLEGRMALDAAVEAATLATRRYAKRQRTWIRGRMADWPRLTRAPADPDDAAEALRLLARQ
ncbi:MAG: tRNA (adenosine(37)-N6)-dimethylallyltransferase MiaA [Pseudomonadota bacterium]